MRSIDIHQRIAMIVAVALGDYDEVTDERIALLVKTGEMIQELTDELVKGQSKTGQAHVVIDWVDKKKRGVAALVFTPTNPKHQRHRIGHLPGEGWFCNECGNKRCAQIKRVKALVPDMEGQSSAKS